MKLMILMILNQDLFMRILMKRSKFNLSHSFKFSCNMARLVPVFVEDAVPCDSFKLKTDAVVRFAPMIAPLMHEVDVYTHYFFVPNRLIWTEWEDFITGGEKGEFVENFPVSPTITAPAGGFPVGSLADYFGMPTEVDGIKVSALPFRAYNLVLNEWFRHELFQEPLTISKASGDDTTTSTVIYNRNWNKDYFTACSPTQQKGPSVTLPLEGNAPVTGKAPVSGIGFRADESVFKSDGIDLVDSATVNSSRVTYPTLWRLDASSFPINSPRIRGTSGSTADNFTADVFAEADNSRSTLEADLSSVVAATINDLRRSIRLQQFGEKNLLGGTRYTEFILSNYGVHSADARLGRPEFLGGGRSPVVFSEVLQTSSTDAVSPLASYAGHGFSAHRSHQFAKSFREHGWVIGIMSVMPRSGYTSQGIDRKFSRTTRYDYLIPIFDGLGEQAVLNQELYADATPADQEVFGYQPMYQEYRKRLHRVAGQMRTSLEFWHLARKFDTRPVLNGTFINCQPSDRIYADIESTDDHLFVHCYHDFKAWRPISKRGAPGIYKI
ncbi:major capsid protein [Jodiemicrovirus-1]|nr:major capsid protein [Jodiemicrovirus-1]